ncbi:MAG TPA: ABC transporter ATP-binding protein [Mycobacteriales bacterium]|nr:ABC transporter ATP-binding protein [Mycobacteriales bacterium]
MPPTALEVTDLTKRYGATVALAGVTFETPRAAITAILGRNGAGKTTTVDICAGLRTADGGSVKVLGLDPRRDVSALRARVGVMPQTGGSGAAGVYPSVRPREVLRLFASFHAHPHDPDALLQRLDLTSVADTAWRRLSGGEQQRLSLALALVGRPELLFLDEPTAALDVAGRHAVWALLEELRDNGTTIVVTTHALDEAQRHAEHVVVIDHGRVLAAGRPADLLAAGRQERQLTFDAPPGLPVDELASALPPAASVTEARPGHYVVAADVDPALVAAVTGWCASRGVLAEQLSTGGGSLEDLYLALTDGVAT